MSELDKEFTDTAHEIVLKLKVAKQAIEEAIKLSQKIGAEGFVVDQYTGDYMPTHKYEKTRDLNELIWEDKSSFEDTLTRAGWHMSSIGC